MPALGHIYGEGWKGNGELCSPTIINPLNEHNQPWHRYSKFVHKLALSPCKKIRFLRRILISDSRSIIKKNIWFLNNLTKSDICVSASWKVKQLLPVEDIPNEDMWRVSLLSKFLEIRYRKQFSEYSMTQSQCDDFIRSLCIS